MDNVKKPIRSFYDLDVYQSTYQASITVLTNAWTNFKERRQTKPKHDLRYVAET